MDLWFPSVNEATLKNMGKIELNLYHDKGENSWNLCMFLGTYYDKVKMQRTMINLKWGYY